MEQQLRFVSHPETKLQTEVLPSDVRKVIVGEDEQQEWSSRVEQEQPEPPHIKEEQEELWTSQEGEQLQGLEEADISKLPFTPVPVKSEDDEEKPQSSQLHQSPAEESREVEPLSSSSTHHLKTEADGDHCGGPEPASNLDPDTLLHPDTEDEMANTPEPDTDDSLDWLKLNDTRPSFNSFKNTIDPENDKRHNTDEKSTTCSVCGKTFSSKSNLNLHKKIHTGEKPFSCSECAKRFGFKGDLKRHMRVHTGVKPFCCSECDKRFGFKGDLKKHMRIHTGEKPFSCSECDKIFCFKENLKKHLRVHTGVKPFICSVCGKRFSRKGHIITHMRTHTGVKPFICSVCSKKFSRKGSMMRHMRTHTGEKPFSCNVCNKRFTQKTQIKSHKCAGENSNSK